MGLIYEIKIDNEANVQIIMTLTSPSCPVAESLPQEVKDKVGGIEAVKSAEIELTFEPAWEKDMMSEEALLELGMM
jgi:metal-sulfur cluster biosynthetic enzyme